MSNFTLADRDAFISRMDRQFSQNLELRKDMNKIISRGNNIVKSMKLDKKVLFIQRFFITLNCRDALLEYKPL